MNRYRHYPEYDFWELLLAGIFGSVRFYGSRRVTTVERRQ
jgi:hypothetical protein